VEAVSKTKFKRKHMKVCKLCGTEKPLDDFYYRKDVKKYRNECKECVIERQRVKKLGVSNLDYEKMFIEQEGQCKICECKLNSSRYTKFAVDHDHKTGHVRGLLCTNCNTALGLMKDSTYRLQKSIDYLNSFKDIV
jgi:hypothetical protein